MRIGQKIAEMLIVSDGQSICHSSINTPQCALLCSSSSVFSLARILAFSSTFVLKTVFDQH
jgi:hypothetical protein